MTVRFSSPIIFILTLLLLACSPPLDFSKPETLSGVWAVDGGETKKLHATLGNSFDDKSLEILIKMAKFDLDFTSKTFVEGEQVGTSHRTPFIFESKNDKVYMTEVNPNFPPARTFIISKYGNNKIRIDVENGGKPGIPLVFSRQ